MKSVLLFFLLIGFGLPVEAAFDRQYEYRSFSEKELEVADYFDKIDSEYTSDILTYSFSPEEEAQFQLSDKKFLASFGSLSRREFMKDMRLKIKQDLSPRVDFKYNYVEQEDYENSQTHSVIEMIWKTADKFRVSVFADLDFQKVNDNIGVSLSYLPRLNHEIKIFYNMVQFDRNKRNADDDRFEKKPYTVGLIGRYSKSKNNSNEYLEYGFIQETKTNWILPSRDLNYEYQRWMGTIRYVNPVNDKETFSFFYQVDHRDQSKEQISTVTKLNNLDLLRNQFQFNYSKRDFENFDLESGLYTVYRDAEVLSGQWTYYDFVPYATVHFNRDLDALGFWSFGYDIDIHRQEKKEATVFKDTRLEHRANIFWTAKFRNNAYLKLAATLDTDDISWEGGNGQFAMDF